MNEIFKNELAQQRRKWKIKQNALKTAKSEEEGIGAISEAERGVYE